MEAILSELHVVEYINVPLVMLLMAVGALIKHGPSDNKKNGWIPVLLIIISVVYEILKMDYPPARVDVVNAIIDAVIASAIAVGLHNSGKQVYKTLLKTTLESSEEEDDYSDDESYEEEEDIEEDEEE